jgi:integrase
MGEPFCVVKGEGLTAGMTVPVYCRTKVQGKYTVYQFADRSSGKRVMRSFTDLDKAKAEAKSLMGKRVNDPGIVTLDAERSTIYSRALENLKPTGAKLDFAAFTYAKCFEILGGDHAIEACRYFAKKNPAKLPQISVRALADELIADKKTRGKGTRYLSDLEYRLGKFAESFPSPVNVASIDGQQIQKWLDALKLSPRSYLNFRRVLGTLFRFAKRKKYLTADWNEMQDIEGVSENGNGGDVTTYTPADLRKLIDAADKGFVPALVIGAFAGLRSAEIERLTWRDVDLKQKLITIQKATAKTRSRRTVPITRNLALWLKSYAKDTGAVWKGTHDEFYDAQQDIARAAGIEWKQNALRHSFITYRLSIIKDENQVALEAGNSPGMIHAHYRGIAGISPKVAKEWFSIMP